MLFDFFLLVVLLAIGGYLIAKKCGSSATGACFTVSALFLTLFFAGDVLAEFAGRPQTSDYRRQTNGVYRLVGLERHADQQYALMEEPDGKQIRLFRAEPEDEFPQPGEFTKVVKIHGQDGINKKIFRPLKP